MATDSERPDHPLDDISDEDLATAERVIKELRAAGALEDDGLLSRMSRRGVLQAAGALGGGALLGGGAATQLADSARADSNTQSGTQGTAANPIDVIAEDIDLDDLDAAGDPWIDVTHPDYGAVGDGSTDDSAAIEQAITDAASEEGTVYFPVPDNYYRVTSNISVIPPNESTSIRLVGATRAATIQGEGLGSGATIHLDGDASGTDPTWQSVAIDRLTVHGSADGAADVDRGAQALRISGGGLGGVKISGGSFRRGTQSQLRLDDCWVCSVEGVYLGGDDTGTYGIDARNANVVHFRDVAVNNISSSGGSYGFNVEGFYAVKIDACDVENSEHAIRLDDAAQSNSEGGALIDSFSCEKLDGSPPHWVHAGATNQVDHVTIDGGKWGTNDGRFLVDNAANVEIRNPTLTGSPSAIEVTANAGDVRGWGVPSVNEPGAGAIRYLDRPSIFVPARAFEPVEGTPSLATIGTSPDVYQAYQLPDSGSNESIVATVPVPANFGAEDVQARIYWGSSATSGNAAVLSSIPTTAAPGAALDSTTVSSAVLSDSTTAHGLVTSVNANWTGSLSASANTVNVFVRRSSGNASDDLATSANIAGVEVELL